MKNKFFSHLLACVSGLMLLSGVVSCEKMEITDEGEANVVIRVDSYEQTPFPMRTRAEADISITKLCFHIYNDAGERVVYVNQKMDDDHFGKAYFSIEKGHYYVLVVGHNASSNPTFNKNEKVTISGKDLGDTFWSMKEFVVEDESVEESVGLNRIVARVNFIPTDEAPEEMSMIRFTYTGSKGTFDGLTGYGVTNVKQKVPLDVTPDDKTYGFYMIPSAEKDVIDIEIETYPSSEDSETPRLSYKKFYGIPVQRNRMTICRGVLFDNNKPDGQLKISVVINYTWGEDIEYNL